MNKKILIVDDCDSISEVIKDAMAISGFEGVVCATCSEAFQKIEENVYAAAIIDVNLPDGHGLQILRALKEKKPFIMVYILTGAPSIEELSVFINQGAEDFFNKATLDLKTIIDTVKSGFAKQSRWNEIFNNFDGTHF